MDGCRKSRPPSGFDPQTAQPVASRYTDDIPAYRLWIKGFMIHEFFFYFVTYENVKNHRAAKTDRTRASLRRICTYRKVHSLSEWPRRIRIPVFKNSETVYAFCCFVRQVDCCCAKNDIQHGLRYSYVRKENQRST